jgi:hypothetical protein
VSALAHYLEEEGIPSVAIALVRPQAERTRPPRALWVPFELGRPFGPPGDPAFQKQVILAAVRLLEAKAGGPVLLADFPEDDPREMPDPRWRPPLESPHPNPPPQAGEGMGGGFLADAMTTEVAALAAPYARSRDERGRTTVGLSGLTPAAAADYAAAWLRGIPPDSPVADLSPILCLRFAVDDLKAYALEAAITSGTRPSSRQLGDWLWNESATGAAIHALRRQLADGADDRAKLIATMFLVPGLRVTPGE